MCGRAVAGATTTRNDQARSALVAGPGAGRQQAAEGSSKLGVEDGVDDRVEETIDVAEPDEEREQRRVHVADRAALHVVADADGVDDVEREERKPARQKHTCTHALHVFTCNKLSRHSTTHLSVNTPVCLSLSQIRATSIEIKCPKSSTFIERSTHLISN